MYRGTKRKGSAPYRYRQTHRNAMNALCSMRADVDALPEGEFKKFMLELLEDYKPLAKPFQERLRGE